MRPLHHSDSDPGWINRKFKDLERQLRQLRTTTVVNLSAADPSTLASVDDFEYDVFTVTTPGAQTLTLDYVPKDDSEHVRWHCDGRAGAFLEDAEWTREGNVITVPDPDGIFLAGDKFTVKYARAGWAISHAIPPPAPLMVPLGASWKYATGLGSSTTYAAVAFDDSAWSVGTTPMGFGSGVTGTTLAPLSNVWQRLQVTTTGGDLEFNGGHDDTAKVYIDGVEVYDGPAFANPVTFTEPVSAGEHIIAVYGTDTGGSGMYIGWSIEEQP